MIAASVINILLTSIGFSEVDCFNDYKRAWVNSSLNKSIVAKVDFIDDVAMKNEIIVDIWSFDGIYSDPTIALMESAQSGDAK